MDRLARKVDKRVFNKNGRNSQDDLHVGLKQETELT